MSELKKKPSLLYVLQILQTSEEVEEAEKYYRMGIDTILTRDYKKVCK